MSLDVARVESYNNELAKAKEKWSKLYQEYSFNVRELDRLCAELTEALGGRKVTPENIMDIYNEEVKKINETLAIGEEILGRISGETEVVNQGTQEVHQVVPQEEHQVVPQVNAVPTVGVEQTNAEVVQGANNGGAGYTNELKSLFGNLWQE